MMTYPVLLGQETIGTAQVEKEGLYWKIRCRCTIESNVMYRILLCGDHRQEDLGICAPEGHQFTLCKRISTRQVPEGNLIFRAVPRHPQLQGKFVPISPAEPFRYLSQLEQVYLCRRDGQVGVVLQDQKEISKPTGQ